MTNTELTLNQLQSVSGGNCTDSDKKKDKNKNIVWACTEAEDCPHETFESSDTKLKKSSRPIPYTPDASDMDGWQTEN